MTNLGLKAELRDGETIRAYLDELVLLKTTIQLWIPQSDAPPFETTINRISGNTFVTDTTPPLEVDQQLLLSFLLDSRRFNAPTRVISTGAFSIPTSVAEGERRERFRATFTRAEAIQVFAIERLAHTFLQGRFLQGALLDLSLQGLRVALDDLSCLEDSLVALARGDTFDAVCIQGLPYTPDIHCRAIVTHVFQSAEGASAGLQLMGLEAMDQRNIERILARRFPTTFGQSFPKRKRRTDIADRPGAPVQTPVATKAPEVVALPPMAPAAPKKQFPRPESTPVLRLRKAARKILVISANVGDAASLADHLREDGFRQVQVAGSFLEAKNLSSATPFDLVLLDVKVGGHFGQMILEALRKHGLLLDATVILVADRRDASIEGVAEEIQAVHIHDRRDTYDDLVPVLYRLLI